MDDIDRQNQLLHGITNPAEIEIAPRPTQVWELVGGHVVNGEQHPVATLAYGESDARQTISGLLKLFGQELKPDDKVMRIR